MSVLHPSGKEPLTIDVWGGPEDGARWAERGSERTVTVGVVHHRYVWQGERSDRPPRYVYAGEHT